LKNKTNGSKTTHKRSAAVSLALGGGGSRGSAHIGVLRALENANIRVAAIAGSSIGGLIAAVYAAGYNPDAIQEKLTSLKGSRMLRAPARARNALIGLEGIEAILREVLGERYFEDLDIPLALTALDMNTGREVVLREGMVIEAVLATIAIPGVFPSRKLNGYELVDGGLSNPVPVAVARSLAPRLPVIAVALSQALEADGVHVGDKDLDSLPIPGTVKRFRLGRAFLAFTRAMNASGRIQGEIRLAVEKPDLIIRPDVEHVGVLDAVDVSDLARRGEQSTQAVLPLLRRVLRSRSALGTLRNLLPN